MDGAADGSAGNFHALFARERQHADGDVCFLEIRRHELPISQCAATEGKVFPGDETAKTGDFFQISQKIFRRHGEKFPIRTDAHHQLHARFFHGGNFFLLALEQRHVDIRREDGHGMGIEGDERRAGLLRRRQRLHFGKYRLMPQVASIKKSDAKDKALALG